MIGKKYIFLILVLLSFSMVFAGCGSNEQAADDPTPAKETIKLCWASDLDPADVADLLGVEEIKAEFDVTTSPLTEDSSVVASLLNDDQDMGNIDLIAAVRAIQMGVPLKIILPANAKVEFAMVAQPEIKSFKDLKGKIVAFHSPGSMTEVLPRMLVKKEGMSDSDITWTVLPESPNRAAAMVAKRIDATALEVSDIFTLQEQGDYNMIAYFTDAAPEAMATVWVVTDKYYQSKPDVVKKMAVALAKGYKKAYDDKEAWMAVAQGATQYDAERLSKSYDVYKDMGMFPSGELLSKDQWDKMVAFYMEVGELEDPMAYEDAVLAEVIQEAAAAIK